MDIGIYSNLLSKNLCFCLQENSVTANDRKRLMVNESVWMRDASAKRSKEAAINRYGLLLISIHTLNSNINLEYEIY